jgi:hypothetical protein
MAVKETLALSHTFYVSDTCPPYDPYDSAWHMMFILWTILGMMLTFCAGILARMILQGDSMERYTTTYNVLKEILAKTDLEERNEAFLDACVEYSKKEVYDKEPEFDRGYGFGNEEEVYSHFIRMEHKRLEESGKVEETSKTKAAEEETVPEEKIANMV